MLHIRLIALVCLILTDTVLHAQSDQSLFDKHKQHSSWSYDGNNGPEHWSEIDPGYSSCAGERQSPIDIVTGACVEEKAELSFSYHPFYVDLINNGHTLIEKIVEPKSLVFQGEEYTLLQFHFHTPSEHHVDGKEYPMEMHFVHQNTNKEYAVIGVLVEESSVENRFLSHFMNSIPKEVNQEIRSSEQATPTEAFPEHPDNFYYYEGSLTTPPCTESVHWIVLEEPVPATIEQIERIHEVIHDDNRPVQELGERKVYHAYGNQIKL